MASPQRENWQKLKKTLPHGSDKLFKEDLGPHLDKIYEAFNAYRAEWNKTMKVKTKGPNPHEVSIRDLPRVKSRIDAAMLLYPKARAIMNNYGGILNGLPSTSSDKKQGLDLLKIFVQTHGEQIAEMTKNKPSDADCKKFKEDYLDATLKQF